MALTLSDISDLHLDWVSDLPAVEYLELSFLQLTDEHISALAACTHLITLTLNACCYDLIAESGTTGLRRLVRLTKLHMLDSTFTEPDEEDDSFSRSMPHSHISQHCGSCASRMDDIPETCRERNTWRASPGCG